MYIKKRATFGPVSLIFLIIVTYFAVVGFIETLRRIGFSFSDNSPLIEFYENGGLWSKVLYHLIAPLVLIVLIIVILVKYVFPNMTPD